MERRDVSAAEKNLRCFLGTVLTVAGLSLYLLVAASCGQRSVETVTTVSHQRSPATEEKPLISTVQLPSRDPILEAAGDRVAEARIDLQQKKIAAALRTLALAEEDVRKALATKPDDDADHHFASIIRSLQITERELQHRNLKATDAELRRLSQELNR